VQDDTQQLPQVGDRVKFRECSVQASGIIIDEFGEDYVRVQWNDFPTSTTHRRRALQIDSTPNPARTGFSRQ